jgi:DivIVA domain-containing protein
VARRKRDRGKEEAPGFTGQQDRPRLTPVDVQQKVFRLAFRGYNERDVDEFLDQVTEDLAALHEENKRLREQVEEGGAGAAATGGSVRAAQKEAEAIVRQAREHAARLTATAQGSGGTGSSTYLLEERRFLQRIASLVQEHAAWLKDEARRTGPASSAPKRPQRRQSVPAPPPVEVAAESSPAPRRSSVDEPTAAWSPESEASGSPEDKDPLVSAWESAWAPEPPGKTPRAKSQGREEGEPSLRELFWGEE